MGVNRYYLWLNFRPLLILSFIHESIFTDKWKWWKGSKVQIDIISVFTLVSLAYYLAGRVAMFEISHCFKKNLQRNMTSHLHWFVCNWVIDLVTCILGFRSQLIQIKSNFVVRLQLCNWALSSIFVFFLFFFVYIFW